MSRRRRRTQPTRNSEQFEDVEQFGDGQPTPTPSRDDDLEPTPEEQAQVAAEDAALEDFDQAVRDGAEELPDGREVELTEPIVDNTPTDSVPAQPDAFTDGDPETREETDLEEAAREVWTLLGEHEEQNVVNFVDSFPNAVAAIPDFEEIFERGPLAAGIRMLEALLAEARIGYIDAQVDELARVTEEDFTDDERRILAEIAEAERSESGLPGVAAAYRTLVRLRAQVDG